MNSDNWYFLTLPNPPLLKCELGESAVEHIWKCIDTAKYKLNNNLAGNISESFVIEDIDSKFWNEHLSVSCERYVEEYREMIVCSRNPFPTGVKQKCFWIIFG